MAKKMTIVEQYNAIIEKAKGVLTAEEIKFLEERAEMHSKKNASRKPTKAQAENEEIKVKILEIMEVGKAYTVTEIQKAVGLDSNQKASALIRQLKESHLVIRTEEKGKAYFTKA
jgi:predicted transcriptional regulator